MTLKICIAGVTGWTGSAIARAVLGSPELELVGAMARTAAGQDVGHVIGEDACGVRVVSTIEAALVPETDVLVDYTHPAVVRDHVCFALSRGVSAVVGTSGLTGDDYAEIEVLAQEHGVGVIAAGNFSLTAALVKHFAGIAARHIPHWEIIDYSHAAKPDAPSGTVQELAEFLGGVAESELGHPLDEIMGARDARGATIGGAQVHALRLPSYVLSFEAIFGLPHERLSVRHDAGSGAEPYVNGTLLAARKAVTTRGLIRGLDTLLFSASDPEGTGRGPTS
jgi:4-hydroxy-tetrahydrodipicolinate reductase